MVDARKTGGVLLRLTWPDGETGRWFLHELLNPENAALFLLLEKFHGGAPAIKEPEEK